MKKKKSPFIWITVLVVLVGIVFVANAKSHEDPKEAQQQEQSQLAEQQTKDAKPTAPSASDLSNKVASLVKKSSGPKMDAPVKHAHSMLEMPAAANSPQRAAQKKSTLETQTLGQWYHKDSVHDLDH